MSVDLRLLRAGRKWVQSIRRSIAGTCRANRVAREDSSKKTAKPVTDTRVYSLSNNGPNKNAEWM